jgi:hypothetical protein
MSEQTKQPDPAQHIQQPSQNDPDALQTVADDVTLHAFPKDDKVTMTDPTAQASQQPARDMGEPTAPMPVQPATTIQVPALPADEAAPSNESVNTPQTPAAPDTSENIPPAQGTGTQEKAPLTIAPTPILATPPAAPAQAATPAPVSPQPVPTAQPHPFISAEDLAQIQLVAEPQVSPDGLLIAYSILKNDLATNTARASIWLVPAVTGTSGKLQ